jgi:hypothetical protein
MTEPVFDVDEVADLLIELTTAQRAINSRFMGLYGTSSSELPEVVREAHAVTDRLAELFRGLDQEPQQQILVIAQLAVQLVIDSMETARVGTPEAVARLVEAQRHAPNREDAAAIARAAEERIVPESGAADDGGAAFNAALASAAAAHPTDLSAVTISLLRILTHRRVFTATGSHA